MRRVVSFLAVLILVPVCAWAELTAWFVDVGQGDCTVVVCDGEALVVDGGPSGASQEVYSLLRKTLSIGRIRYVVSTHPHEDHVGGLPAERNC